MNLTVDSLRNFSGSVNLLLNTERQSVERAGKRHSIASFFGVASAQAANRQTFEAIKHAVLSDERFFGVHDKVCELLSTIDANKAIKAEAIKSIVGQLDQLSTPARQEAQLLERFEIHLANRDLPKGWENHLDKVKTFLKYSMGEIISKAGGAGRVNVSIELQKICDSMQAITNACRNDSRVFEFATALFAARVSDFNTLENTTRQMEKLTTIVAELRQLEDANPGTGILERGLRMMASLESLVKPGVLTAIHTSTQRINREMAMQLGNISPRGLVFDAHQFLSKVCEIAGRTVYPQGAELREEAPRLKALKFICDDFVASLSRENRETLLRHLMDERVQSLRVFYQKVFDPFQSGNMYNVITYNALVESLQNHLDLPQEVVDMKTHTCNFDHIPLKLMADFPVQTMFTRTPNAENVPEIKRRMAKLEDMETVTQTADAAVRAHIKRYTTQLGKSAIGLEMKKHVTGEETTFEKDIKRTMVATLPNGVRLPNDMEAARDAIVQYIAQNPQATYQSADGATQKKACLMMSLLSQETVKLADTVATVMPFDNGVATVYGTAFGEENVGRIALAVTETADGGWLVTAEVERSILYVGFPPDDSLMCKAGSKFYGEAEVTLSHAEIERLSQVSIEDFATERAEIDLHADAVFAYGLITQ